MAEKDIISKDILKRLAVDIARVLLHLDVDYAEIIDGESQHIFDRRADLVARMSKLNQEDFIAHFEVQGDNEINMPWRMLQYYVGIGEKNAGLEIRQYLIYIGKARLTMADGIHQSNLDYRYTIIDMHTIDCALLLAEDNPDALVLAILCDFKGRSERDVARYILHRLQELTADNETRYREYVHMLEILSTNRNLKHIIEEEEKMLSEVECTRLPSFNIGWEKGMEEGIEQGLLKGEATLLERLLSKRFGYLNDEYKARLNTATLEQLETWGDRILDARKLADVFENLE